VSGTATSGGQRLRELMVVVEVALAIVLLVGAGLMVRSFARLGEVDPGFRQDGVVSVSVKVPRSRYARSDFRPFFEEFVERVGQLPGIKAAGAVSDLPMSNVGLDLEMEFTVLGLDAAMPTANPNAEIRLVIPGYFGAMGMEIVSGRGFDQFDTSSERFVGIVNETIVERYFPEFDPIGRSVDILGIGEVEIIGVAADTRNGGLQSKYESEIFLPYGRIATQQMQVVALSDMETAAVARAILGVLRAAALQHSAAQRSRTLRRHSRRRRYLRHRQLLGGPADKRNRCAHGTRSKRRGDRLDDRSPGTADRPGRRSSRRPGCDWRLALPDPAPVPGGANRPGDVRRGDHGRRAGRRPGGLAARPPRHPHRSCRRASPRVGAADLRRGPGTVWDLTANCSCRGRQGSWTRQSLVFSWRRACSTMYDMSTTLTVRTDEKLDQALRALARSEGVSLSEFVRGILEDAVDELSVGTRAGHLAGRLCIDADATDGWSAEIRERNWRA